jgi:hypothetical protein
MNFRELRPSPSMVVALLALAIALGGTAYAANKIGTNQIKSNAVTTAKIKNNAVTTPKIKSGAVTNGKISSAAVTTGKIGVDAVTPEKIAIGAVTSEKIADDAVSTSKIANDAVNASKISDYGVLGNATRVTATDGPTQAAARSAAPLTTLFTRGPLTVTAKCFRDSALNDLYGEMYVSTTANFSIMEGTDTRAGGALQTDYLNVDTLEVDRQLDTQLVSGNGTSIGESETMMAAPGGPFVSMVTGIALKNGPVFADGPYGPGNVCLFQGGAFG